MPMENFMRNYKKAWEEKDEGLIASLFTPDGVYRNTPFDAQHGRAAIQAYWQRIRHTEDIHLQYEVIHATPRQGVAHWRTTDRVISEEIFAIWARSAGTNLIPRQPGDPLPRRVLDGIAVVDFDAAGLAQELRIWWHSRIDGAT